MEGGGLRGSSQEAAPGAVEAAQQPGGIKEKLGLGVWGFKVWGLDWVWILGSKFGVWGLGFRVQGSGFRV